jgi:hypothetical protein
MDTGCSTSSAIKIFVIISPPCLFIEHLSLTPTSLKLLIYNALDPYIGSSYDLGLHTSLFSVGFKKSFQSSGFPSKTGRSTNVLQKLSGFDVIVRFGRLKDAK